MKVSEFIDRTKALIDTPEKWCKGAFKRTELTGQTSYCMLGAANKVAFGFINYFDLHKLFKNYVADALSLDNSDDILGPIPEWNDAPERTHKEVMEALDKAKELAIMDGN